MEMVMRARGGGKPAMPELSPGQVYAGPHNCRRVIAIFQGRVFYSVGTDKNRDCLVRTMQRWIAGNAELIHEGARPNE